MDQPRRAAAGDNRKEVSVQTLGFDAVSTSGAVRRRGWPCSDDDSDGTLELVVEELMRIGIARVRIISN